MADGANVQQWDKNGTGAQTWDVKIADGGNVIFLNRHSGMALNLTGSSNGANVNQSKEDGSLNQDWHLTPTAVNGWVTSGGGYYYYDEYGNRTQWSYVAYRAWEKVKNIGSTSRYIFAIDNSNCHTVVFSGSKGNWKPVFDWVCGVGNDKLGRTFRGITYVTNNRDIGWATTRTTSTGRHSRTMFWVDSASIPLRTIVLTAQVSRASIPRYSTVDLG